MDEYDKGITRAATALRAGEITEDEFWGQMHEIWEQEHKRLVAEAQATENDRSGGDK
jgi:hypothetical protein